MTISLTCVCGARLEIDPKFAGQTINCPDCNRPLVAAIAKEPDQTSGLALASITLALVGFLTVVGSLLAVACGMLALGRIARAKEPLGGRSFALAGVVLGGAGAVLSAALLYFPEWVAVDGLLRSLEMAGKIDYRRTEESISFNRGGHDLDKGISIRPPSPSWGKLPFLHRGTEDMEHALVDVWEDAYILCLSKPMLRVEPLETCREEGMQYFYKSRLIREILGRQKPDDPPLSGQIHENSLKQLPGTEIQELLLDITMGGRERTFLMRIHRDGSMLSVIAAGTRKSRFQRLEPQLRKALDSVKIEK
ncbi:MAG: DUF4190 domain-containing protein [Gemmataceae bacterium]|nr:DUF4190 domain-containing protein [Gemmataceae bacterium]